MVLRLTKLCASINGTLELQQYLLFMVLKLLNYVEEYIIYFVAIVLIVNGIETHGQTQYRLTFEVLQQRLPFTIFAVFSI